MTFRIAGMITEPLREDLHLADADGRVLYASLNSPPGWPLPRSADA